MTLAEIRAALADRSMTRVAEAIGAHRNTVAAIRDGRNLNPSYRIMRALADYLAATAEAAE